MADNVTLNSGAGGAVLATDDISSVHHQKVKVEWGPSDTATQVDTGASALPIQDGSNSITVDHTALDLLHTSDFDTGAGTDTTPSIGIAVAASGGAAVITGDTTNGLDVDVTRVQGTVTVASHDVTNAGTFAVQATVAAGATNIAKAEDAASANADVGVPSMAVQKATPANTAGADGDYEFLQMSAGRLWTSATIDAALPAGTNAIGKLAANSGVDIGDVDVTSVSGNVTVVQSTASSLKTEPAGNVAHDAADSGNPIKIGAKAETSPKGITVVADADRTDLLADADGMLMVKLNTSNADRISERVTNTDGASTAFTNFSAVASTFNYVTAITVFRSDAGSSLASVDFRDGTAGSVLWSMPLPPNGGSVLASPQPLFRTSANTALAYDVSAALTTVTISVSGFQSKV